MSRSSDTEDGYFVAMDTEEDGEEPVVIAGEVDQKMGSSKHELDPECGAKGGRTMSELPEEVLEYILSFLSPYQEHKTAALVCKQWYRLIKGIAVLSMQYYTQQEDQQIMHSYCYVMVHRVKKQ